MLRRLSAVALLLLAVPAAARADEAFRTLRDIAYSTAGGPRNSLDLYAPASARDCPVVVWIHGGGWRRGDKLHVQQKPAAFTTHGCLLVCVNYRFHPQVTYREQGADIAAALRWVHDHSVEYGGDPRQVFLMGHSAGAHLAALVATDHRYLRAAGLSPDILRGVILLDGAGYDIPRQFEQARGPRLKELYASVFTEDAATQADASPVTHVAAGTGIPPFLILHVASRRDSAAQSESLAQKLRDAGVAAEVVPAAGKTHMTINRELGAEGDAPTRAVFDFLEHRRSAPPQPQPQPLPLPGLMSRT